MIDPDAWRGLIRDRQTDADLSLVLPERQSNNGGSGAFLAVASDQRRYWVKPLNNQQGERVPITEQIVGRAGALLEAPSCEVRTVLVEDENAARHALIFALYDWCWGTDPQWLIAESDQHRYYSHDHGLYLSDGGGWTIQTLQAAVDTPHEYAGAGQGRDIAAAGQAADRLDGISRDELAEALSAIPATWPVSNEELEIVGWFLERRARQVSARLRQRLGGQVP